MYIEESLKSFIKIHCARFYILNTADKVIKQLMLLFSRNSERMYIIDLKICCLLESPPQLMLSVSCMYKLLFSSQSTVCMKSVTKKFKLFFIHLGLISIHTLLAKNTFVTHSVINTLCCYL